MVIKAGPLSSTASSFQAISSSSRSKARWTQRAAGLTQIMRPDLVVKLLEKLRKRVISVTSFRGNMVSC